MSSAPRRPISRRELLRGTFGMSLGVALTGVLAACGETQDDDGADAQEPIPAELGESPSGTPRPLYVPDPTATPPLVSQSPARPTATPAPTATPVPVSLQVLSDWERSLAAPLFEQFTAATGVEIELMSGEGDALAERLLAGNVEAADIFLAHDAGALGALVSAGLLAELPSEIRAGVDMRFQATAGEWVGVSGRALVFLYDSERVGQDVLPATLLDLAQPRWRTLLGWAPVSDAFAALTAALVAVEGAEATEDWLANVMANRPGLYDSTVEVARAVVAGEIGAGVVAHTDLLAVLDQAGDDAPVGVHWFGEVDRYDPQDGGDPGALMLVRGAAVLRATAHQSAAEAFIAFLLSPEAQAQLAELSSEYSLLNEVDADSRLLPLDRLQTPVVDLATLFAGGAAQELLQDIAAD